MKPAFLDLEIPLSATTSAPPHPSHLAGPGVLLLTFSRTPIYVTAQAYRLLAEMNRQDASPHHGDLLLPVDVLELCTVLEARLLQPRESHDPNQPSVERSIQCGPSVMMLRAFGLPPQHILHGSQILILIERINAPSSPVAQRNSADYLLTERQLSIVHGITRGLTNKQLANELGISIHTVKEYLRQVMMKLNATSRTAIVSRMAGILPAMPQASGVPRTGKRREAPPASQIA